MGSKLSRFSQTSTRRSHVTRILDNNAQPAASKPKRRGENHDDTDEGDDRVYPFPKHQQSSSSTLTSCSSCEVNHPTSPIESPQHHKLSIESLVSIDGDGSDDENRTTTYQRQGKKCLVQPAAATGRVVNLAELDPLKVRHRQRMESESERLFREEQERQDKEKQQERAKTARLKRRSELYGGSNADLSKGANGVKSAESVLRLIGSGNSNGPELLSSSSSRIQKYLASLPPPQPASTLSPLKETGTLRKKSVSTTLPSCPPLPQPGSYKPTTNNNMTPGSHKGVSRVRESEVETISRSAQYIRKLNSNKMWSPTNNNTTKKLSPLVTEGDLSEKTVLHSPSKGIAGQTSAWRLVPLQSLGKTNDRGQHRLSPDTPLPSSFEALPECPMMKNRSGVLLEGDLTMNKIEAFLETREHIDKTEFDMVVRNLVEQETPENARIQGLPPRKHQQQGRAGDKRQPTTSLPEFQTPLPLAQHLSAPPGKPPTNNENRFVAAPYHPDQSKFYGKKRFFEPAAYVHFPNVSTCSNPAGKPHERSTCENTSTKLPNNKNLILDGSKSSMKSERSENRDGLFSYEVVNAQCLMSSFNSGEDHINSNKTSSSSHKQLLQESDIQLASTKGLPPVSTVPLVMTKGCIHSNSSKASARTRRSTLLPKERLRALQQSDSSTKAPLVTTSSSTERCRHEVSRISCRFCNRPPSRGGRVLMDWLQRRTSI